MLYKTTKQTKRTENSIESENGLAEKELENESERLKRTRIQGKKLESSNEKHREENNAKTEET